MISGHEAWIIAAQWGSYIREGDPGACMYGFNGGPPQSIGHRDDCLEHIETVCRPIAVKNGDPQDLVDLRDLEEWLRSWWPKSDGHKPIIQSNDGEQLAMAS